MRPGRSPGKPSSFCHCDASRRHRQSPHRASTAVEQPGAPGESLTVGDDLHRTGIAVEPSNALAQSPGHRPSIDLGDDHDPPSTNVQGLAEPLQGGHLRTPTAHRAAIHLAQFVRHFSGHHHRDTVHPTTAQPPDPVRTAVVRTAVAAIARSGLSPRRVVPDRSEQQPRTWQSVPSPCAASLLRSCGKEAHVVNAGLDDRASGDRGGGSPP